jgi:hypothetical protein
MSYKGIRYEGRIVGKREVIQKRYTLPDARFSVLTQRAS